MSGRPIRLVQAGVLFFGSGALGLGYELIWIRKAALVVGASQIAMSTVLTSFFLGLGVGSLVVGRRLRSARLSPLSVYGLFEIGIGIWALAFPALFALLERVYGGLYPLAGGSAPALFGTRFLLLFLLCLPPTFLMGGTLPLLLDGLVREDRSIGSATSTLYGINILGAVLGVLVTCYAAIPRLGMNGTTRLAGIGNLLLGALALWWFRRSRPLHDPSRAAARPDPLYAAMAFASGMLAIAWQIGHARFFSLVEVTTIYLTAMLLAVWLLGLATGSLAIAPLLGRRVSPLAIVAAVQALVPLAGLHGFSLVGKVDFSMVVGAGRTPDGQVIPLETMQVLPHMAWLNERLDAIVVEPALRIAVIVLPPVLLLGVCLPALIAAATRHTPALRSVSGSLVFWNTLGSSAGAFLAGYVLLPLVGLHRMLVLLACGSLVLAGVAWLARERRGGYLAPSLFAAAGLASVLGFALRSPDLTRSTIARFGFDSERAAAGSSLEVAEGAVGTAYVLDDPQRLVLGAGAVAFASANKHGVSAQAIQGHLPVLFYPGPGGPRRCLGIGIGSGQSLGALLLYPIERLDVVDIFPRLVDLSLRRFAAYNHGLGDDQRVRIHHDDGRHFVERAPDDHYDVISMEPPPPRADGVYSLYSLGFYREVRRVLAPGGVFMQWLPLYRVTPLDARGIIKTQAAVFPETFVVKQGDEDFMLLSYRERPTFDAEAIRSRCRIFAAERMLAGRRWSPECRSEIATFEGVVSALLVGPQTIRTMEGGKPYDDDRQRLCYGSGDRWLLRRYHGEVSRLSFAALTLTPMADLASYFAPPLTPEQVELLETERAASLAFFYVVDPRRLARYEAQARGPGELRERVFGNLALAAADDVRLHKQAAFERVVQAVRLDPGNADQRDLALARRIVRNYFGVFRDEARAFVADLEALAPGAPLVRAAREAFDAAEQLERARRERYLFPER